MGIGRVIGAAAPIAAGYFTGGSGASLFGLGATGSAIAAGALTGAGIAALSGQDALTGAVTGGLGGMGGGELASAVGKAGAAATTAQKNQIINQAAMGNQMASQAAYQQAGGLQSMMANPNVAKMGTADIASATGAGGYTYAPGESATRTSLGMADTLKSPGLTTPPSAQFGTDYGIADIAREYGEGSVGKGYAKMGLAGLGVASGAGAFDQEPITMEPREEERYDPTRRLNLNMDTGISKALKRDTGLRLLAGGGYLETGGEVGDGMSDEIEATIEGTQEARLSDGEFVIPADVVSHLGNGSSDAGAKRLYEMMDKVRMARTGTKKQGIEIKPERYMPA